MVNDTDPPSEIKHFFDEKGLHSVPQDFWLPVPLATSISFPMVKGLTR